MALSFADTAYFEENFGSPPSRVADRLDQELARASRYLRAEMRKCGVVLDQQIQDGILDPDLPADVVCEMVISAAASPAGVGVSSVQQGAGPFQETQTYTNPVGDLYVSKKQKRLLGCGQVAFTVDMAPAAGETYTNGLPIGWLP